MAINNSYTDNFIKRIEAAQTCSDLAIIVEDSSSLFTPLINSLTQQIAGIEPLLTPPTGLTSVISWISNLINTFVVPYQKMISELASLTSALSTINSQIAAKQRSLKCS